MICAIYNNFYMKLKDTFTIIILFALLIFNFYIGWFSLVLEATIWILLYLIIFYGIYVIWKNLTKKEYIDIYSYSKKFLYSISWFVLIIFGSIWTFSYYYNEISPATMPEYTLTNGKKTITFQAMIHIWTQNFYDEILNDLIKFKQNGWAYFFEWVRPWTTENMEKFNKALWIEFSPDLYENFSKLYGVTFQDTQKFLWQINDLDFNVDLSIDDIMKLYDEKIKETPQKSANKMPIDANAQILDLLSQAKERELKILVYLNQAILNFLMKNSSILESMTDSFSNKEFFEIIIWERNKILVNAIENSEYDNIFVTYWLLHFEWVYSLLKEHDPNWKIINEKKLYPIK